MLSRFCKAEEECFSKENLLRSLNYDMAAKKRKKDLMNNNSKVPCESKTPSKTISFHISEGRTHAKTIYQTWALYQESMRMLCNVDEGRSSPIMLFIINFPSFQCFDNHFTSVECDSSQSFSAAKMRQAANINTFRFLVDFHREKWIYVHKGSTKEVRNHVICFHISFSYHPC